MEELSQQLVQDPEVKLAIFGAPSNRTRREAEGKKKEENCPSLTDVLKVLEPVCVCARPGSTVVIVSL